MGITDELWEWANTFSDMCQDYEKALAIADHIDAEHQKACDDAWNNGYEADYLGIEKWLTEHPQVMEHHGWVHLPKDADGEYIRIGDVLTDDAEFKSEGKVMRLMLEDDGWMVGLGCGGWTEPSIHELHHHRNQTVEDVLREFAAQVTNGGRVHGALDIDSAIAECAPLLRLAGED